MFTTNVLLIYVFIVYLPALEKVSTSKAGIISVLFTDEF